MELALPYTPVNIRIKGHPGFLLLPNKTGKAKGIPWVWYAPTLSNAFPNQHHHWLIEQLYQTSIAFAGIDIGESWGSPAGRELFSAFFAKLIKEYPIKDKACLLPQSRGGMMLYTWAAENPEKTACLGGIYPVCDLTDRVERPHILRAYGLTATELKTQLKEHNPINRLEPLARAGVPILHVHGDNDTVVPLEKHSAVLIERYKKLGGPAELVIIPGGEHDMNPAFFRSPRLLDFFIKYGGI
jgi:dipeptidyl aminopeptidase/acylaminoacyl peptidase